MGWGWGSFFDGAVALGLCSQEVSQAPQQFSRVHGGCFASQSVCSVICQDSGMPQGSTATVRFECGCGTFCCKQLGFLYILFLHFIKQFFTSSYTIYIPISHSASEVPNRVVSSRDLKDAKPIHDTVPRNCNSPSRIDFWCNLRLLCLLHS